MPHVRAVAADRARWQRGIRCYSWCYSRCDSGGVVGISRSLPRHQRGSAVPRLSAEIPAMVCDERGPVSTGEMCPKRLRNQ
jgi:hypothetical protein